MSSGDWGIAFKEDRSIIVTHPFAQSTSDLFAGQSSFSFICLDGKNPIKKGETERGAYIGVAVLSSGQFVLANQSACKLHLFDNEGLQLTTYGEEGTGQVQFKYPYDVTVDAQDNIYVADAGNHRVQILTSKGEFIHAFGEEGTGPGKFLFPTSVRLTAFGEIIVLDQNSGTIQIFDDKGNFLKILGENKQPEDDWFQCSFSFEVDFHGNLLVVEAHKDKEAIVVINQEGNILRRIGEGYLAGAFALVINLEGDLFVTAQGIKIFG